jgi:regulator of replication initiation timing
MFFNRLICLDLACETLIESFHSYGSIASRQMNQWRSRSDQISDLEHRVAELRKELEQIRQSHHALKQQHQTLRTQNDRLLKMEAQHQSARKCLMEKKVIFSRAVILFPSNIVIGDRLENCVLKVYRGVHVLIDDTAELINCRIIGLEQYSDGTIARLNRPSGTIEIKGIFYNTHPRRFAISTYERVVIHRGVRFRGNVCASSIVIPELTKIRGRFASRELLEQRRKRKQLMHVATNLLEGERDPECEVQVKNRKS